MLCQWQWLLVVALVCLPVLQVASFLPPVLPSARPHFRPSVRPSVRPSFHEMRWT